MVFDCALAHLMGYGFNPTRQAFAAKHLILVNTWLVYQHGIICEVTVYPTVAGRLICDVVGHNCFGGTYSAYRSLVNIFDHGGWI